MDDDRDAAMPVAPMHRRRIELADGRYMIFYTFGDDRHGDRDETRDSEEEHRV
jgi:hypothetical protein